MPAVIQLGNLTIDGDDGAALIDGQDAFLSGREFEILRELAYNPDRVLSRKQLLKAVWSDEDEGSGRKLSVHVCRLRKKLRGSDPWSIASVRRRGYILSCQRNAP